MPDDGEGVDDLGPRDDDVLGPLHELARLRDVGADLGLDADRHAAQVLRGDELGRHRGQDEDGHGEKSKAPTRIEPGPLQAPAQDAAVKLFQAAEAAVDEPPDPAPAFPRSSSGTGSSGPEPG